MAQAYVIGAGLSGLSAAAMLAKAGHRPIVFESAGQAGGRCRTFFDRTLGREIDNGNHLIMSGNIRALAFLDLIGAGDAMTGPREAAYPFVDIRSGARWRVRLSDGPLPAWVFDPARRVPDTTLTDYLKGARIALARKDQTVADVVDRDGRLYKNFWEPLTLAVLNTTPEIGSARLLWSVIRETFLLGGAASRPLAARTGLGHAFVDPAVRYIEARGGAVRLNARLRAIEFDGARAARLDFAEGVVEVSAADEVVLAIPPSRLRQLLPALDPPDDSASILNVHYRLASAAPTAMLGDAPFIGMISSDAHWAFVRGDVVSLTVSASHAIGMEETPNEDAAKAMWKETQIALGLGDAPYEAVRVIRERRATPDQSPASVAKRLPAATAWANVTLAGDHTDTGVPATIEGSIRSGETAAGIVAARLRRP